MAVTLRLNGSELRIDDDRPGRSLLDALRSEGGVTSPKDGCAPQGQCGCCTVLVDGRARVACVTPLRRVAGRQVETVEGLDPAVAARWAGAFVDHGASQCGFCTPGIVMRLEDRRRRTATATSRDGTGSDEVSRTDIDRALAAHLCRCTGWQGITEAAVSVLSRRTATPAGESTEQGDGPAAAPAHDGVASVGNRGDAAAQRAALETGGPQRIDRGVALGGGGFAADTAPADALVALVGADGDWVVGESVAEARELAGKVQGRRTTLAATPPLEAPPGDWDAILATSWTEPAYLETDASWCEPGGEPASPLANGGAFGAKRSTPLPTVARRLADEHGRAVLALWSREDAVRHGPKRPPLALGMRSDGTGVARVVGTPGIAEAISLAAPGLTVEELDVPGPPTSVALRAAGWAEALAACVAAGAGSLLGGPDGDGVRVDDPAGGWARVAVADGTVTVTVGPGEPLEEVVVRSYATGAVHMAAGLVCSESLAVDAGGEVHDLTMRSFGILGAAEMPPVEVRLDPDGCSGPPARIGDAVFAAAAAALWRHHDFGPAWPLGVPVLRGAERA